MDLRARAKAQLHNCVVLFICVGLQHGPAKEDSWICFCWVCYLLPKYNRGFFYGKHTWVFNRTKLFVVTVFFCLFVFNAKVSYTNFFRLSTDTRNFYIKTVLSYMHFVTVYHLFSHILCTIVISCQHPKPPPLKLTLF